MWFVEGKTGVPFVDANMRELAATGFMSNRGRQVGTVEYHKLSDKVQLHYWQLFLKPIEFIRLMAVISLLSSFLRMLPVS